jgi:hypothetical protein
VIAAQPNDLLCAMRIYVAGYTDWARNDLAIGTAHRLGGRYIREHPPVPLFAVTDGGNVVAKFSARAALQLR